VAYTLPSFLKGDIFMSIFKFQPYFIKLDTYLDLRDLALSTKSSYRSHLKSYLTWISETLAVSPEDVTYENIRSYILYLKNVRKLENHTINAHNSLIQFFRLYILKQEWNKYEVPRMKYNTPLPLVLSKEESLTFIETIPNLKQKAFISLLYSSGLRISEVCHLRVEDIKSDDQQIFIRCSKNRADRYASLSPLALAILRDYWKTHGRPRGWLFPGQKPDSCVTTVTASLYVKNHLKKLGWTHPITSHTFRHSFATHHYEQGTDLLTIQKLLGHRSINSTIIYVHLAKKDLVTVISPFDMR
jgi:integrase/recombinase XerD